MKAYQGLVNSIKRGVIMPVYLFYGTETYLMDKAVTALKKYLADGELGQFNLSVLDAEKTTLAEIIDTADTLPFFAERRLVIVENAPYFKNKRNKGEQAEAKDQDTDLESLLAYLQQPNPSTCLVFLAEDNVNKAKKVFKALEKVGQAIEFAPLTARELSEWVTAQFMKRGKKIESAALEYLLAISSQDLGVLSGEIEKLSLLDLRQETVTLAQVKIAASASVEASIFNLVDFIGEKRMADAIKILREMLGQGEPPVRVLVMISRQIRLILAAKSLGVERYTSSQLAPALGVHPYVAQKLSKQSRNFSFDQLEQALQTCLEIDLSLKTGKGDPSLLLEFAIISIITGQVFQLSA